MLEIASLGVRYGRHLALEGVSVKVDKGEICVILGANGAGKSSLLKAVAGMVETEPGSEMRMNGKSISGMKPHRIVEEGIALVPEGRGIFGDLSVAENLQLGAFAQRARSRETETLARIYELFPRLAERKKQIARTMSGGEQQMVAIGRALMSKPDILMLDEPSLGLSPLLTKELFRSLKAVAETGVGILLVEQNAKQSLKIAERGYLIENGAITGEGTASALMNDPAVINAYLGGATGTGRAASPGIRLPGSFALPVGLAAMGRFMADLAARAGAIQTAFIRFVRRGSALPSAFVGRYDPAAGGDPWDRAALEARPSGALASRPVSRQADALSGTAADMADAAAARLAAHLRAQRLTSRQPSAFLMVKSAEPPEQQAPAPAIVVMREPAVDRPKGSFEPDFAALTQRAHERLAEHIRRRRQALPQAASLAGRAAPPPAQQPLPVAGPTTPQAPARSETLDAAGLARSAAERMAAHIRRQREARSGVPAPVAKIVREEPRQTDNGAAPSSLLGHNSGRFDIGRDEDAALKPQSGSLDYAGLAARAASIHAAHLAAGRKSLVAYTFASAGAADDEKAGAGNSDLSATKGRKKNKEN